MSILASRSGLIQSVKPGTRIESGQTTAPGVSSVIENLVHANVDPNSPRTGAGRYDGLTCFGLFVVDESQDGA